MRAFLFALGLGLLGVLSPIVVQMLMALAVGCALIVMGAMIWHALPK